MVVVLIELCYRWPLLRRGCTLHGLAVQSLRHLTLFGKCGFPSENGMKKVHEQFTAKPFNFFFFNVFGLQIITSNPLFTLFLNYPFPYFSALLLNLKVEDDVT